MGVPNPRDTASSVVHYKRTKICYQSSDLLHFCAAVNREIQPNNFCTKVVILAPSLFILLLFFVRVQCALAVFVIVCGCAAVFCSKKNQFGSNFFCSVQFGSSSSYPFQIVIMKFGEFVSADICQVAAQQIPAHRATLYHRRRKVAEKRLHKRSGFNSWSTAETLSCVYSWNHAVMCMGGYLFFLLFFHCLLRKWRRHKDAYPNASRYASRASAVYLKISRKVFKIWRRNKRALDRKLFHLKVWCLVLYYMMYGKLYRARVRFKKKLVPLVQYVKSAYMKMTFSIYCHLPPLRVSAMVIFLGLFMSGNVELNPGPKEGKHHNELCPLNKHYEIVMITMLLL